MWRIAVESDRRSTEARFLQRPTCSGTLGIDPANPAPRRAQTPQRGRRRCAATSTGLCAIRWAA